MAEPISATKTKTTSEILGAGAARELLQDIFADLHPGLIDETRDISSIFTAQAASEFLGQCLDGLAHGSLDVQRFIAVRKVQEEHEAGGALDQGPDG